MYWRHTGLTSNKYSCSEINAVDLKSIMINLRSTQKYMQCNGLIYQSPLILTELFQHNLINVSYLTACYLYQVMMTLHFLNDVANDTESTQK